MKADTLTVKDLFQKEVRYVIPSFQRPYVWTEEDQWEPLWSDLRGIAERYLAEKEKHGGDVAKAEQATGTHFLGAVVLQQQPTASAEVETRTVIDGQQRMTTLQLVLDATQEVFENLGHDREADRLHRLVKNPFAKGDAAFKLWPSSVDQEPFRAAMENGDPVDDHDDTQIVLGHEYFKARVREWLQEPEASAEQRAHGLETALFGLLVLVVIDLGASDEAHSIFETLNARGTPLLASDLAKNYALQLAGRAGLDPDATYAEHWSSFDERWWRKEVRQGRLVRPRVDAFLQYWLACRLRREVGSHEVFTCFREYAEAHGIRGALDDLALGRETYRSLEGNKAKGPAGFAPERWRALDVGVAMPFLLWLFSRPKDFVSEADRTSILGILESYLVRRTLCRLTIKSYNKVFLELVSVGERAGPSNTLEAVHAYLAGQTSDATLWPGDRQLRQAVLELPLYRSLTRRKLRMVLEAVEDRLRTPKSEELHVAKGKLTIEHIMPRRWGSHWPVPDGVDAEEFALERDRIVHTLGNLTLVNNRLNPSLSNAPWESKRESIQEHSVLYLNKELLAGWHDAWSEPEIAERGEWMLGIVLEEWPGSEAVVCRAA